MVSRSHDPNSPLAGVLLDEVMADLVHEAFKQDEVFERFRCPINSRSTELLVDRCASSPKAIDRFFRQIAQSPWWLQLLVQHNPAGNLEPGDSHAPGGASD
jgi:hypothetical protein